MGEADNHFIYLDLQMAIVDANKYSKAHAKINDWGQNIVLPSLT